jgi:Fe-Mn family superoxide dismutase
MFQLKKLNFDLDALEGLFSKEQLEIHYTKHHQAYCDNFNKALENFEVEGKSTQEILAEASKYNQAVINHGGGF